MLSWERRKEEGPFLIAVFLRRNDAVLGLFWLDNGTVS